MVPRDVQQLVNLLLMRGNIGEAWCGYLPRYVDTLNVQGDRTVRYHRNRLQSFLARLGERYGFHPPHAPDDAELPACKQYVQGRLERLICMGAILRWQCQIGEASAVPLTQLGSGVYVATKQPLSSVDRTA